MHTPHQTMKHATLLIGTILLALALVGGYLFLFLSVKEKNEHISALTNDIEAESVAESTQHSVKVLVAETSKLREKLKGYLVGKDQAVSFLEFLEREGERVGVTVKIESVVPRALSDSTVEELALALTISGAWPEVVRFIGLLEFLPFESRLGQTVVYRTEKQNEGPWLADIEFTLLKEK